MRRRFLEEAAKKISNYQGPGGAEKLGAHMMGRWKSGIMTSFYHTHKTDIL